MSLSKIKYAVSKLNTYYEPAYNLLYALHTEDPPASSKKRSFSRGTSEETGFSNVFVWDIAAKDKQVILPQGLAQTLKVVNVFFETAYNELEEKIVFNANLPLFNTQKIAPRPLAQSLILLVREREDPQQYRLFSCHKTNHSLKELARLEAGSEWHLDVGNQLIRVIHRKETDILIHEFPWQ